MTARGTFTLKNVEGVPVVETGGEIDLTNVHEFEGVLNSAARADAGIVIVSLESAPAPFVATTWTLPGEAAPGLQL